NAYDQGGPFRRIRNKNGESIQALQLKYLLRCRFYQSGQHGMGVRECTARKFPTIRAVQQNNFGECSILEHRMVWAGHVENQREADLELWPADEPRSTALREGRSVHELRSCRLRSREARLSLSAGSR